MHLQPNTLVAIALSMLLIRIHLLDHCLQSGPCSLHWTSLGAQFGGKLFDRHITWDRILARKTKPFQGPLTRIESLLCARHLEQVPPERRQGTMLPNQGLFLLLLHRHRLACPLPSRTLRLLLHRPHPPPLRFTPPRPNPKNSPSPLRFPSKTNAFQAPVTPDLVPLQRHPAARAARGLSPFYRSFLHPHGPPAAFRPADRPTINQKQL